MFNVRSHVPHHALGMVARLAGRPHDGAALRVQPRYEDCRLHLRARDLEVVLDGVQVAAPHRQRQEGIAVAPHEARAHLSEGIDDPSP